MIATPFLLKCECQNKYIVLVYKINLSKELTKLDVDDKLLKNTTVGRNRMHNSMVQYGHVRHG